MKLFKLIIYNHYSKSNILILLFILLNCFIPILSLIQTGKYPYIKRLNNGNYIILSSTNITFVDDSFTQIISTLNFDSDIFSTTENIQSTIVTQFKPEDNGYILAILYQTLYIFSPDGEYIKDIDLSLYINGKYSCSLIPNSHSVNNYFLTFIYALSDSGICEFCKQLVFKKITFNPVEKTINISDEISIFNPLQYTKNNAQFKSFFSCDIMKNNGNEYIACFYGNNDNILCSVFNRDNYEEVKTIVSENGLHYIKLLVLPNSKENAIFCSFKTGEKMICKSFNINSESFSDQNQEINCQCGNSHSSLIMEYFYETNNIIIGCLGDNSDYYLSEFTSSQTLENTYHFDDLGQNIGKIGRINIILPSNQNNYYAFTFPAQNCQNTICEPILKSIDIEIDIINTYPINQSPQTTTLICNGIYYYNYDHTSCIESIPDGYYCNNSDARTIDKCHNNCKTCNEGPSTNNHSCILCKDEYYYDLGNCLSQSECNNGIFTDNSIKKCKCRNNNKCLLCNSENICISCNTDLNYYQKKDDSNNNGIFVNCYNNDDIGNGYYLNNQTKQYEPCYEKCNKCNELGDANNNKCIECKSEYSKIKNKNDIENCYDNCPNFFYFDNSNTYICLNEDKCPTGYKLIYEKKKCIDNCSNDNIYNYKYEYNNVCYQNCPTDSIPSTSNGNLCELKCENFGKYYNYNKTECILNYDEGYFCDNPELKTIDKCHNNCKTCNNKGTDENNNCLTCPDDRYYYLGNCLFQSECTKGFFSDNNSIKKCKCIEYDKCEYCSSKSIENNLCESCNTGYYPKKENSTDQYFECYNEETIDNGYYLNNNLYESCYSTCKKCDGQGDINNNKCTSCIEGYSFIDNNNYGNCYLNCEHYFYFNNTGGYQCTIDDNCPDGYKLINGKKKCIDKCENDNIYNYNLEYDNVCFNECPGNSHISSDETNKCIDELICNDDEYYNYNHTACIPSIPEGYYCNSSQLKTIDKCHENCKTCKKGGNDENNNCETCPSSGTKFFDLGNCKESCEHDSFINGTIETCKCTSNISCFFCTKESNELNLCVSCNTGYYPKSDEIRDDGFVNCYNNPPEGYYLNGQFYDKCYQSCKSCDVLGDENDNKCTECKSTYEIKNDSETDNNCYEKCTYNYYYDANNKYHCINDENCPSEFSKLIREKKKCIDDCSKDNIYKKEFNNECYIECPPSTHPDSNNIYKCISDLNCELNNKYYSYDLTECIDRIPDGFYCNDETHKTIEKCHDNCKTCSQSGNNENNNCDKCKDEDKIYFNYGNCLSESECINGIFIDEDSIKKCKCIYDKKCKLCNDESKIKNLCLSCNMEDGYYPKSDDNNIDSFINCYKNPEGYFLNNQVYEPCFSSCKYCLKLGNETDNKCTECKSTYEIKNDFEYDKNCYKKCPFNYYYDSENKYQCTNENSCPMHYNKLILEKKRCIDDCRNDNIYKYEYKNNCYDNCPSGTKSLYNDSYICEEIKQKIVEEDKEICMLNEKKLNIKKNEIENKNINLLTVDYAYDYGASNNFVSKQDNKYYTIYIYKNLTCLKNVANEAPQIDFGECYEKIKKNYNIKEELIITLINIKGDKNTKSFTKFNFSNPLNGELLNINEVCSEEKIIIEEDVMSLMNVLDDKKEDFIIYLTKQGIDVFNISERFYNDLCFPFESPNGKDVPMKDRISSFYPNITLCDEGCENKGVDLENMKAKCECIFNNLMNNDLISNNLYGQAISDIMDILSSLNIGVMKCIKDIFNKEQFKKCIGGFFILVLLFGQLICIFIYALKGLYILRKYLLSLVESYEKFIKKNDNSPPKKNKANQIKVNFHKKYENNIIQTSSKTKINNKTKIFKKNVKTEHSNKKVPFTYILDKKQKNKNINESKATIHSIKNLKSSEMSSKFQLKIQNKPDNNEQDINNIKDLLSDSFDETDFDDVLNKEKRTFCQYFYEKFKNNQIFINSFFIKEIFRPRPLKILLLINTIELYFVINALFYNEEYLSKLFNSKEEDTFFGFIPRRFNEFIYISMVNGFIAYLIGYFFIEENKIKRIFFRNKNVTIKIKYDISLLIQDINKRFNILIFMSVILSVICFLYISCFNVVYPYIRIEWIKSSIFILILMQIINLLLSFFHSSIRYLSLKYNSQKLFKLCLWFE